MIALPVFFFAIYIQDRCRSGFLYDNLRPDFGKDIRSSQHTQGRGGFLIDFSLCLLQ